MKTNFISNLKQFLFIVLAVCGTFIGYSQPSQNPSIGGSKVPSTDPLGIGGGGNQTAPRDNSTGLIVFSIDIKTNCIFSYPSEIGGGGKGTTGDVGQFNDLDFNLFDIGGKSSSGGLGFLSLDLKPTGGKGTSTDPGQVNPDNQIPYDIGGRGDIGTGGFAMTDLEYIPGHGCNVDTGGRDSGTGLIIGSLFDIGGGKSSDTGTGFLTLVDTGGNNGQGTSSDPGQLNSNGVNHYDIGGRGTDSGTGLLTLLETGGKNGQGTSTGGDRNDDDDLDTGGRNSSGTTGELIKQLPWVTACLD